MSPNKIVRRQVLIVNSMWSARCCWTAIDPTSSGASAPFPFCSLRKFHRLLLLEGVEPRTTGSASKHDQSPSRINPF